jgi:UDP-glucose 4-epimerase
MQRVVVTGAAGFIGSNLCDRLLAEGFAVTGVDDLSCGVLEQVPAGVDFVQRDVRAPGLEVVLRGAAAVFHLAAKNCISDCQQDPVATASINVGGTVGVLEACRQAGVRRFIHAETSALYEGVEIFPTPEDEVAPRSVYAVSKAAARGFVDAAVRHHGLQATGLRYFCVYGPRQDYRRTIPPLMSAFILHALRGTAPTIFGTGSKRRDFVYVDDVNDFHVRCLHDERTIGGTFNIGSGQDHSVLEILAAVHAVVGQGQAPQYRADLPGEAERTCADITRARALGWGPAVGLRAGLERSVAYIRDRVLPGLTVAGAV